MGTEVVAQEVLVALRARSDRVPPPDEPGPRPVLRRWGGRRPDCRGSDPYRARPRGRRRRRRGGRVDAPGATIARFGAPRAGSCPCTGTQSARCVRRRGGPRRRLGPPCRHGPVSRPRPRPAVGTGRESSHPPHADDSVYLLGRPGRSPRGSSTGASSTDGTEYHPPASLRPRSLKTVPGLDATSREGRGMASVRVQCPNRRCRTVLAVPSRYCGQRVRCSCCGQVVRVPLRRPRAGRPGREAA